MPTDPERLRVLKTYKLFIGGKFPRTESGRSRVATSRGDQPLANYCQASRKDLRDAVRAARNALPGWSGATAYLRGQILYRLAEMLESRSASLADELTEAGFDREAAGREIDASVDRLVYFAGWSDKLDSVFGSVNPVASPHWNVTGTEPSGVIALICPDDPPLLGLTTLLAACTVSGNTAVLLASQRFPLPALTFAEAVATSDVPAGTINILSGQRSELAPVMASHMDVNGIVDGSGDPETAVTLEEGAAANLKRVHRLEFAEDDWFGEAAENPYRILEAVEFKTAWHPAGF